MFKLIRKESIYGLLLICLTIVPAFAKDTSTPTLEEIKILIVQEKWLEAKQSAEIYRQHYPQDVDGVLELGVIKNHEKNYAEVVKILGPALVKYPNYLDIRLTLINAEMGLKQPQKALSLIEDGLILDPNNETLLKKKADIQFENGDPVTSAKTLQQLLSINPQNDKAKNLLTEIQNTPPEYGIGPYKVGVETWTADTKNVNQSASTEQTWYYDSLYLGANTDYGYVQLSGNYANRLGFQGTQGKLEFDPKINSYLYFELVTGYSEQEVLFPHYLVGGEGYLYIPHLFDVSLGETYRNLGATYLNTYTGSLSKSIQQYWFSFKPYYFVPSNDGPQSVLYTAKIRRYFGSPDFYVELSGGMGHSPDLPDLLAAAFIKVKNNYAQVKLNFPLDEHRYVLSVGPQYEKLSYPSGTTLTLWSGELDLSIRFN